MYTYGYIKTAILAKLNLTEKEALEQDLLDTFPYNINECISQIASTIKPRFDCVRKTAFNHKIPIPVELETIPKDESLTQKNLREFKIKEYLSDKILVGDVFRMPQGFIAFSGKSVVERDGEYHAHEVHEEVVHVGNDKIIFLKPGCYTITYDASWMQFSDRTKDSDELDIPTDILMCLPSYVASQIWKIDDERKAAIYRNEFEILFSRINNSDYRGNKTFAPEGGW